MASVSRETDRVMTPKWREPDTGSVWFDDPK